MAEITTDDLKRFAELIGWTEITYHESVKSRSYWSAIPPGAKYSREFPNFLAPENLHLVFEGLERFCKKRDWRWILRGANDVVYVCHIKEARGLGIKEYAYRYAYTLNAAIIKAILASSQEG